MAEITKSLSLLNTVCHRYTRVHTNRRYGRILAYGRIADDINA